MQNIDALEGQAGITMEDAQRAMELIVSIARDATQGIYKPETLQLALNALNYDNAVADASYEGEVAGRNARISERLRGPQGDGVASLSGANNVSGEGSRPQSIFDIAAEAQ